MAVHAKEKTNRPLELIERVIQNYGPTATSLDTRGVVHTAAGRHADAIKDLKLAVQLSQNPIYRYHLAVAYDGAGNVRNQEETLRFALADKLTKEMLHPKEYETFDRLTAVKK